MNELKLRGKACQIRKFSWGCRFAINFYAGKDKDKNDKAIYAFIDCKSFKDCPEDRQIIEATGWLSYEKVLYKDKDLSRLIFIVKEFKPYDGNKEADVENYIDDDLGF